LLVIHFCPSPGCNQRKWIPTLPRHRPLRPPTPAIPSYRATANNRPSTSSNTTASSFLFIPALSPRPRLCPSNILSVRYPFRNLAAPVELSCQPLEDFPSTRPVRFGIFLLAFLFLLSCIGSLACFSFLFFLSFFLFFFFFLFSHRARCQDVPCGWSGLIGNRTSMVHIGASFPSLLRAGA